MNSVVNLALCSSYNQSMTDVIPRPWFLLGFSLVSYSDLEAAKLHNSKVLVWSCCTSRVKWYKRIYLWFPAHTVLSWCDSIFVFCVSPRPPVETWVWLAALTVPSAWPRRPLGRMTSLRSQKVLTEWRRGWPSSGIKLWWGLRLWLFFPFLIGERKKKKWWIHINIHPWLYGALPTLIRFD